MTVGLSNLPDQLLHVPDAVDIVITYSDIELTELTPTSPNLAKGFLKTAACHSIIRFVLRHGLDVS